MRGAPLDARVEILTRVAGGEAVEEVGRGREGQTVAEAPGDADIAGPMLQVGLVEPRVVRAEGGADRGRAPGLRPGDSHVARVHLDRALRVGGERGVRDVPDVDLPQDQSPGAESAGTGADHSQDPGRG